MNYSFKRSNLKTLYEQKKMKNGNLGWRTALTVPKADKRIYRKLETAQQPTHR